MKKKINIFILILAVIMGLMPTNVNAREVISTTEQIGDTEIISYEVDESIIRYADSVFLAHLASLNLESNNYSLGKCFTVLNVNTYEKIVFFPIVQNNEVEFMMMVNEEDGKYTASVSVYFSEIFEKLFIGSSFMLITDGVNIAKCTASSCETVYNLIFGEFEDIDVKFRDLSLTDTVNYTYKDLIVCKNSDGMRGVVPSIRVIEEKTINVKGVAQSGDTCWAATCAALINYYKSRNLTYYDVASYVFPNNPNQGGNWDNMRAAYNHWGLYPTQTGVIGFSTVKNNINKNQPMHLRLVGHSLALIGFSFIELNGNGIYERILVLLEPNGGVRKTVSLKENNNFDYYLGGTDAWLKTIIFY